MSAAHEGDGWIAVSARSCAVPVGGVAGLLVSYVLLRSERWSGPPSGELVIFGASAWILFAAPSYFLLRRTRTARAVPFVASGTTVVGALLDAANHMGLPNLVTLLGTTFGATGLLFQGSHLSLLPFFIVRI